MAASMRAMTAPSRRKRSSIFADINSIMRSRCILTGEPLSRKQCLAKRLRPLILFQK
jgi:hypothetical protein